MIEIETKIEIIARKKVIDRWMKRPNKEPKKKYRNQGRQKRVYKAFNNKRPSNKTVRGPNELHNGNFFSMRINSQADGVKNGQRGDQHKKNT